MALDGVKNFAKVEVSTGYDASATSIVLSTDEGAKLPDPSTAEYNVVWWNFTDYPDPSDDPNVEIVRVTAKSTDTLTVTRNQESSGASTKNTSGKTYKMVLGVTAKMITDIEAEISSPVAPIEIIQTLSFENSARYSTGVGGTGAITYNTDGIRVESGATASSYAQVRGTFLGAAAADARAGNPQFSSSSHLQAIGTNAQIFIGAGNLTVSGTGITFTANHMGFKIIESGGTATIYGTQANGTSETATAITTVTAGQTLDLIMKVNSSASSVDYYCRKNGGTISTATTITTNFPSSGSNQQLWEIITSNASTANNVRIWSTGMSYRR